MRKSLIGSLALLSTTVFLGCNEGVPLSLQGGQVTSPLYVYSVEGDAPKKVLTEIQPELLASISANLEKSPEKLARLQETYDSEGNLKVEAPDQVALTKSSALEARYDVYHVVPGSGIPNPTWQSTYVQGAMAGTTGNAIPLLAIRIWLNDNGVNNGVTYQTHHQTYGWLDVVTSGQISGNIQSPKRMEAIKIWPSGIPGYHTHYQGYRQDGGWMPVVSDGAIAGTTGIAKRLEAIKIWYVYY